MKRASAVALPPGWIALSILALALMVSAVTPILTLDTDLWYHLRHGRMILDTGELPSDTSFSFLSPVRPFVDYYWLFQVVAQAVFQLAGYSGLIALRTLCLAVLLLAARRILTGSPGAVRLRRPAVRSDLATALALGLTALVVLPRALLTRPHDVSYALLAVTLAGLLARRTPLWLPLVALLWVNFHGVTYPVLWTVVAAFAADVAIEVVRGERTLGGSKRRLSILGLMALAPLLTPHGAALLPTPFRSMADASRIIGELIPIHPAALVSWSLDLRDIAGIQLAAICLWLVPWLLWRAHLRAGIRPSRWLLLAAGLVLFQRSGRFHVELALLSLPLVADAIRPLPGTPDVVSHARRRLSVAPAVVLGLVAFALGSMATQGWRLVHPLDHGIEMPRGVVSFLDRHGDGGKVFHPAAYGGYFLGKLDDRYLITMDLELPFAFLADDYYEVLHALYDGEALAPFLRRHDPEFLAVGREVGGFGDRLRQAAAHYRPVFVDDAMVLWANERSRPDLVERWQLRVVDPERLLADPDYLPVAGEPALSELNRLVRQAPDTRVARRALVRLALASRRSGDALRLAEELAALPGRDALDLRLLADTRAVNGDDPGAVSALEMALARASAAEAEPIHRRLAFLQLRLGRLESAYHHLRKVVDVDRPLSPADDLRLLARLARELGHERHSAQIEQILAWRQAP